MSANPSEPSTDDLQRDVNAARDDVDRTLDALQERFSVRRRIDTAVNAMCPDITTMIRMDHTHVLAAFRRFRSHLPNGRKRALVDNVCIALEVHAQLEEEIFYPALREVAGGQEEALNKSKPEHDEMRTLISALRRLTVGSPEYDDTFRTLIRTVLHHVADEETVLLPLAEDRLSGRLGQLGWEMTRRRMQLLKPHLGEVARTTARTFPVATAAAAVGVLSLVWLALRPRRGPHRLVSDSRRLLSDAKARVMD